eukprot:8812217-Prorocentrum_lima.AAC.1
MRSTRTLLNFHHHICATQKCRNIGLARLVAAIAVPMTLDPPDMQQIASTRMFNLKNGLVHVALIVVIEKM